MLDSRRELVAYWGRPLDSRIQATNVGKRPRLFDGKRFNQSSLLAGPPDSLKHCRQGHGEAGDFKDLARDSLNGPFPEIQLEDVIPEDIRRFPGPDRLDLESGLADERRQRGGCKVKKVVRKAEPLPFRFRPVGHQAVDVGRLDHQQARRLENPADLLQQPCGFRNVFQHVVQRDDVESAIGESRLVQPAVEHVQPEL